MKRTFYRLLATFSVTAIAACGGPEMFDVGAGESPEQDEDIVAGQVDPGHPTVGKIRANGQDICTGTLIGAKTVLTAAHCIQQGSYAFILNGVSYSAKSVLAHPQWNGSADNGEGRYDIAVLLLNNAPPLTPTIVATTTPAVGEEVILVGYGVTSDYANDYGTKRITTNKIDRVNSYKLYWTPSPYGIPGSTCYGDSGGPAFVVRNGVELQAGVTSGGATPCNAGYSWDTRVDIFVDWLKSVSNNDVNTGGGTTNPVGGTTTVSGSVAKNAANQHGPYAVKAGTSFEVVMTGSGDPDLYVKFGSAPTTTSYDCRPYKNGASETCSLTVPSGQTNAYIMVVGFTAASYSLSIKGINEGTTNPQPTEKTVQFSGTVAKSQNAYHGPLSVVAGTTFTVIMSGSGDPDLYVRFGAQPTSATFNCRPYLDGANESCQLTVPTGQSQAFIMVNGYTAANYLLNVTYTSP